jgi:molybdate transport repressor ModE-like protein
MLDLQRLNTLVEVARTGSFSKAAQSLLISQPTVWTHIHQLESELKLKLVERLGRRIHLTRAAEQILAEVKALLGASRSLEQSAAELRGDSAGSLRLGASTTPGLYLVPPLLGELHKSRPQASIQFHLTNSARIPQMLLENQIDVGLLGSRPEHPMIASRKFMTDEIILIGPREAGRKPPRADGLAGLPLILREAGSGTRRRAEQWCAERGFRPQVVMELDQPELVRRLVEVGVGWAFVSRLSLADEGAAARVFEARLPGLPLKRDLYAAWHRDKAVRAAAREFLDGLDATAARLSGRR